MKRILSLTLALLMLLASFMLVSCKEEDGEEKAFTFICVHADGSEKSYEITTEKEMLGDALIEEGIIAGENGAYGLYVTTVDGEYHKWEDDGKYWALYIGDAYASTGVDTTKITDGATYTFKAE